MSTTKTNKAGETGGAIRFTEKQLHILEYINRYISVKGVSPTLKEIAKNALAEPVTKITVFEHLNQLEDKGVVKREKFKARNITILIDIPNRAGRAHSLFRMFAETVELSGRKVNYNDKLNEIAIDVGDGKCSIFRFDSEGCIESISCP